VVPSPIWDQRPDLYYPLTVTGLFMWGALCFERTGLSFTISAGLHQHRYSLRSESSGNHDHIVQSKIRDSLNLQGQLPVFTAPRSRVGRLYPQALDSLLVASYDSQVYGGGIGIRLHQSTCKCQSQSCFTTGGLPSMNSPWHQAP
jgi:hypothetical protein